MAEKQRRKFTKGTEEKLNRNSHAASGIIFRIRKCFIRSKHKLPLIFSLERQPKKFKNHLRM
jgi:hypothetical protein